MAAKHSNFTSLLSFLQAHHIALNFISVIFWLIKLYSCNYLSSECGMYIYLRRADELQLE